MTEQKPIYNTLDDYELHKIRKATIDNEPLSTKALHEIIVSQSMTIDRLLADKCHYMDVMKKLYDDIQALGVWLANQTTQQKG